MCFFRTPRAPKPPPRAPEAPRAPDPNSSLANQGADARRQKRAAGQMRGGTILTGARGVQDQQSILGG
jgi:hypothetical protein